MDPLSLLFSKVGVIEFYIFTLHRLDIQQGNLKRVIERQAGRAGVTGGQDGGMRAEGNS